MKKGHFAEQNDSSRVLSRLRGIPGGLSEVISKKSMLRRAEWLLRLAGASDDPDLTATLVKRAADLKEEADQFEEPDPGAQAPDVKRET